MNARLVTSADLDTAASVLTDAFLDDPTAKYLFPDEPVRERGMRGWFDVMVASGMRRGHTYLADGCAASVWAPPDTGVLDRVSGAKLLDAAERIGGADSVQRMLALGEATAASHPHEPHFYLMFVGVASAVSGTGIGPQVISPVLDMCDRMGFPAYLEATTQRAVPFYQRFGFTVMNEIPIDGNTTFTAMWRPVVTR